MEEVNADDPEAANATQGEAGTRHVTATSTADRLVRRGMKACLRLDVIVDNLFDDDPEALSEWGRARPTVQVAPGRPRKTKGGGVAAVRGGAFGPSRRRRGTLS